LALIVRPELVKETRHNDVLSICLRAHLSK
jgi:hypothetical protein